MYKSLLFNAVILFCFLGCNKQEKNPLELAFDFDGARLKNGGRIEMSRFSSHIPIEGNDEDSYNGFQVKNSYGDFMSWTIHPSGKFYDLQIVYAFNLSEYDGILVSLKNQNPEYSFIINNAKQSSIHIKEGYLS